MLYIFVKQVIFSKAANSQLEIYFSKVATNIEKNFPKLKKNNLGKPLQEDLCGGVCF